MTSSPGPDRFDLAVSLHQSGRLPEAEEIYRQLLAETAEDAVLLNLLGALRLARGDVAEARELLSRSIALDEEDPTAWLHLAEARLAGGCPQEAVEAWISAAAAEDPQGVLHARLDAVGRVLLDLLGAAALFERCSGVEDAVRRDRLTARVERMSAPVPTDYTRAKTALARGDLATAERRLRAALEHRPDHPESLLDLGSLLSLVDRLEESEQVLRRAVAARPTARSLAALAGTLGRLERHREALGLLEQVVREEPGFAEAWVNLAETLTAMHRHKDAMPAARRAVELDRTRPEAWKSLASALEFQDPEASISAAEEALRRRPDFADAEMIRAQGLLRLGRFLEGWPAYEARWRVRDAPTRRDLLPRPDPNRLEPGTRVLVTGEQGVGDEIMFASMLADLEAKVGPGVIECDRRIVGLLGRSFPSWQCKGFGDAAREDADVEVPLGSLGRLLRGSAAAFEKSKPFLYADRDRRAQARERLLASSTSGPRIGVSWHSANRRIGAAKSIPLEHLAGAVASSGGTLIDLQYDSTAAERTRVRDSVGVDLLQIEEVDRRRDLDGLAAIVAELDAVVTIDNTTIHLAGGLGVPSLVLLPFHSDWRWTIGLDRALWYPQVRIARQAAPGDWTAPLRATSLFVGDRRT